MRDIDDGRSDPAGPDASGAGPEGIPALPGGRWFASLRFKLVLLVLLAMGPALTVVVHSGLERRAEALEQAGLESQTVARTAARLQEAVFDDARQFLNVVALQPQLELLDPEACGALFLRTLRERGRPGRLGVLGADGRLVAAADAEGGIVSGEQDASFFQRALQSKRFSVGHLSEAGGTRAIHVGYPVTDAGGAVRAVLFCSVDLRALHHALHPIHVPEGGLAVLLDEGARTIASLPDPSCETLAPAARVGTMAGGGAVPDVGTLRLRGADGVARRFGFAPLRSGGEVTGAVMGVGVPETAVTAAVEADLLGSTWLVLGTAMFALAVSWLFGSRFIMHPVDGLVRATRRLSAGEIKARRNPRRRATGELGQLERAFDEMALSLEVRTSELREAEARYRRLVEAMPAVLWSALPGEGLLYVSPQIFPLTGMGHEEWASGAVPWEERAEPADRPLLAAKVAESVRTGSPYQAEYRIRTRGRPAVWVREHGTPEGAGAGGGVRLNGFLLDVTERKVLEQQFLQAQKMEALGRLSASVAHDFNNLLTVIGGYGQLLQMRFGQDPAARVQLEEIARAADRASVLTRQLLHFSRKRDPEPVVVDINEALVSLDRMIRRLIGDRIAVDTDLDRDLWMVRMDRGQLDQVVMNLAVNARDAMASGGRLALRTENAPLDAGAARALSPAARPGEYVRLTVADDGCGMDEAVRARIFEPFFTTKGEGKGTGLGLSTVDEIVRGAGGFIVLESAPGRGTAFRIHLPRHAGEAADASPAAEPVRPGMRGKRILLVEDDPSIRGFAREFLRADGHVVVEAGGAEEARRLSAQAEAPFDVLVVDVSLPDGDGGNLARELSPGPGGPRVVVMSGFSPSLLKEEGTSAGGFLFLQKPFRPADLRAALAKVFAPG